MARFAFPDPLYPIADAVAGRDMLSLVEAVVAGGARLVQLRAKDMPSGELVELARAVKLCAERAGARLIVNDRADVARLVGAAGVHLGQQDLPPDAARAIVGPDAVVGLSTHNAAQLDAALRAGGIASSRSARSSPPRASATPIPFRVLPIWPRRARAVGCRWSPSAASTAAPSPRCWPPVPTPQP